MTPEAARLLLDVSADASLDEIERAFRARQRMMHPDRFAERPESEIRLATADFQRLERAYRVLREANTSGYRPSDDTPKSESEQPRIDLDVRVVHRVSPRRLFTGGVEYVTTAHGVRAIRIPPRTAGGATVRAAHLGAPDPRSDGVFGDLFVKLVEAVEPAWGSSESGMPREGGDENRPNGGRRRSRGGWWAAGVALVVAAFVLASGERWTQTLVPEQPETFRSEEYSTGTYKVVDDGNNPCWVGQGWTSCMNSHIDEYNRACVGHRLDDWSMRLCSNYSDMIDEMRAEDGPGWEVETLGSYGRLTATEIIETRQVSNEDYRPAVTREVVCYAGFIGECR